MQFLKSFGKRSRLALPQNELASPLAAERGRHDVADPFVPRARDITELSRHTRPEPVPSVTRQGRAEEFSIPPAHGQRRPSTPRRKAVGRILKPFVLTSKLPDGRCRVLERNKEARREGRDDFKTPRRGREGRHRERWSEERAASDRRRKRNKKKLMSSPGD